MDTAQDRALHSPLPQGSDMGDCVNARNMEICDALLFIEDKSLKIAKVKCNQIYKLLINGSKSSKEQPFRTRTSECYGIGDDEWSHLYTLQFNLSNSTQLRAFHWKVTHGLVYGNKQLYKFGYRDYSNCHLCTTPLQTFSHLLLDCPSIHPIWNRLTKEFSGIFDKPLTNLEKELGVVDSDDDNANSKNLILIITRFYFHSCNVSESTPSYAELLSKILFIEKLERNSAFNHCTLDKHQAKWEDILNCLSISIEHIS